MYAIVPGKYQGYGDDITEVVEGHDTGKTVPIEVSRSKVLALGVGYHYTSTHDGRGVLRGGGSERARGLGRVVLVVVVVVVVVVGGGGGVREMMFMYAVLGMAWTLTS